MTPIERNRSTRFLNAVSDYFKAEQAYKEIAEGYTPEERHQLLQLAEADPMLILDKAYAKKATAKLKRLSGRIA